MKNMVPRPVLLISAGSTTVAEGIALDYNFFRAKLHLKSVFQIHSYNLNEVLS
jgi:hypothetical protein